MSLAGSKPPGLKDSAELIADIALEGFERGVENVELPGAVLIALRQAGLARRPHHADQHRLVGRTGAAIGRRYRRPGSSESDEKYEPGAWTREMPSVLNAVQLRKATLA